MFGKKNEKLATLKDMIGSRAGYLETVQLLKLDKSEKDIYLRASIEVNKKKPNSEIIDKAYAILVSKSYHEEDIDTALSNQINNAEEHQPNNISNPSPVPSYIEWEKFIKPIIILLILSLALVSGYKFINSDFNLNMSDNEIINVEKTVERNKLRYKVNTEEPFTGIIEYYDGRGQKEYERHYVNGKKEGKFIEYYPSGQKKYAGSISENKLNGRIVKWYKNGQKEFVKTYKNGVLNGESTRWKENGLFSLKNIFNNGVESNKYVVNTYYSNGNKKVEVDTIRNLNGKPTIWYKAPTKNNGKFIEWYKNGEKKVEAYYKNGELTGKVIVWNEDGNVIAEVTASDVINLDDQSVPMIYFNFFLKHLFIPTEEPDKFKFLSWYQNGQKRGEAYYKNGKFNGEKTFWYEDSQKKRVQKYLNGELEGKSTSWDDTGAIEGEETFVRGELKKRITFWNKTTQKRSEENYQNGELEGKFFEWYENGEKKVEENYQNGKLNGKSFEWYENGEIKSEEIYKNGLSLTEIKEKEKRKKASILKEKERQKKAQEREKQRKKLQIQREKEALQKQKQKEVRQKEREKVALQKQRQKEILQEQERIEEEKAKEKGCYYLNDTLNIGTIEGYTSTNIDGDFIFDKKYYILTSNRYTPSSKKKKRILVVRKTGRSRSVPLSDIYPYSASEGESEYSKRALNHKRHYPASKFRTLEVLNLVGDWNSVCQ